MGNCLRPNDRERNSDEFEPIPTLQTSTKNVWFKLLKVETIPYFQSSYLNHKYQHPSFLQIDKDIDRTYPNQAQFHMEEIKKQFKKVLQQIALHFPKAGYIQGINFPVGFFLLQSMNEIQTIKCFISYVTNPKLMMLGLYEDDFPLVRLNCQLFWSIFEEQAPQFSSKIKELNIPDQLWVFQWFLCLFLYSFPPLYMKDILTFIWEEKQFACIRIALSTMAILQPLLVDCKKSMFQDQFISSMEMLKTQEYVIQNLPVRKLIKRARLYDNNLFKKHLKKISIDNWYKDYFLANEEQQTSMHKKFMSQLESDRMEFMKTVDSGLQPSERANPKKSLTIIDYIEQLRVSKIGTSLVNSLNQKAVNSSFVRHQQRYSLSDQHESGHSGHLTLVQSIYHQ